MTRPVPPLRVAVWTTGNVVCQAVRAIIGRPDLELVGAYARSPEKDGLDVGELCGLHEPLGIVATRDVDALLALALDCVLYAPLHVAVDELALLLRSGVNVVTTSELATGSNLGRTALDELQRAAVVGDATLFGSGMNPGFAQLLAGVATGITDRLVQITVSESVDVGAFVGDANFEAMGWGRPREDPGHADDVRAGTAVFAEAVELLARLVDAALDEVRCDVEFAHAIDDVHLSALTIERDHVAAMDVRWIGVVAGRDAIQIQQRWMATTHVEPPWTIEHGYRVEVVGDPNVRLGLDIWPTDEDLANLDVSTMHGIGMRITAVPVINAIPAVCAAPAGIATYASLPVICSPLRTT